MKVNEKAWEEWQESKVVEVVPDATKQQKGKLEERLVEEETESIEMVGVSYNVCQLHFHHKSHLLEW